MNAGPNHSSAGSSRPTGDFPVPGKSPAESGRRWMLVAGVVAGLGAAVLLYLHRPAGQFFYPRCSWYTLTGLYCPGCGGLRASHELLHGHLLVALRSNALLVLGLPVALGWWGWCLAKRRPVLGLKPPAIWAMFAVMVMFTVLRNLPGQAFAWLAP